MRTQKQYMDLADLALSQAAAKRNSVNARIDAAVKNGTLEEEYTELSLAREDVADTLLLAKVYAQLACVNQPVTTSATQPPTPEEDRDAPPSADPLGDVLGVVSPLVGLLDAVSKAGRRS